MSLFHVSAICLFVLPFTQCADYKAIRKIYINEKSTTLNVFPSETDWAKAEISDSKRLLINSIFSKSTYKWQCRNTVHLEPIYFYPGDTVRIECVMCSLTGILNGEPKGWARYTNISKFIENYGSKQSTLGSPELVQNDEHLENSTAPKSSSNLGTPYYHQDDGFLVIDNANSLSQGVYFCFDRNSEASHRHFHILIPMVPIVHVETDKNDKIKEISEGCAEKHRKFPHHFWQKKFKSEPFDDVETCFIRNGKDDWACGDGRLNIRFHGCENPASSCRTNFTSDTLPVGTSLSISLNWSPWSECKQVNDYTREETRTAECFIKLDRPLTYAPKKWKWLTHLNALQRHVAFKDGVPLFSGLLASWLYGVEKLDDCWDEKLEQKHPNVTVDWYNQFFADVFKSFNLTDASEAPKSAFKYCLSQTSKNGTYDILYGTLTEDKRSC